MSCRIGGRIRLRVPSKRKSFPQHNVMPLTHQSLPIDDSKYKKNLRSKKCAQHSATRPIRAEAQRPPICIQWDYRQTGPGSATHGCNRSLPSFAPAWLRVSLSLAYGSEVTEQVVFSSFCVKKTKSEEIWNQLRIPFFLLFFVWKVFPTRKCFTTIC